MDRVMSKLDFSSFTTEDLLYDAEFKRGLKQVWSTIRQRAPYYVPVVMWLPKYNLSQWVGFFELQSLQATKLVS